MKKIHAYGEEENKNFRLVIGLKRSVNGLDRKLQQLSNDYGITPGQFGVLEALYHLGDLKICQLIEKTLTTSGNMTVIIRNLVKDHYVEKLPLAEDKRVSVVHLTEKGKVLMDQVFPDHMESLQKSFKGLTDREKDQLAGLLKKLNGL